MNHHCIWDASIGKWDDTEKIHTLNNIYIYSFFENQLHSFLGSIQHIKILKKKKRKKRRREKAKAMTLMSNRKFL